MTALSGAVKPRFSLDAISVRVRSFCELARQQETFEQEGTDLNDNKEDGMPRRAKILLATIGLAGSLA